MVSKLSILRGQNTEFYTENTLTHLSKLSFCKICICISVLGLLFAIGIIIWLWFSSLIKVCHVDTLNLYQKLPDKMQKKSGQSNHSILRKHQTCVENTQNDDFLPPFWQFLRNKRSDWPDSFCILSHNFWHKFRVPTWLTLVRLKNHEF